MKFILKSQVFDKQMTFTDESPPHWLLGREYRWFWDKYVLTLGVGESVDTDFNTITRFE